MIVKEQIKAIAFDFGGTLDSPFMHWMDIYLKLYNEEFHLDLTAHTFRDSYVYAEQMMERLQPVQPSHSLYDTQLFKIRWQIENLLERAVLSTTFPNRVHLPELLARAVTDYSSEYVIKARSVLEELVHKYTLLLVSNYYGNLRKITTDLGIVSYFLSITDSTLEGIRKPDAALWKLAIDRVGLRPEEVLVVGDSLKNDILPASQLGCQVVQACLASAKRIEGVTSITNLNQLLELL